MTDTTETDLVDLLFSQEVADNPHAMYGRLRDQCPVSRTQSDGESALVLISRYQDVLWALRHPEIFSSAGGTVALGEQPLIPVEVDPPRHTAYRRLLNPQFVHARLSGWGQTFRAPSTTSSTVSSIEGPVISTTIFRRRCPRAFFWR